MLNLSSSGNTNDDNSHTDDLNLTEDRGVNALIQSDTSEDDSSMIPFSCTIFSDVVVVEADGNRLSRSFTEDFRSRLSIYFQNVNRLRTKTSDSSMRFWRKTMTL
jgi:hypothetical protein